MLSWWLDRLLLSQGMPFNSPNTTNTIITDASMEGWGGHCIMPGSGTVLYSSLWTREKCQLHINALALMVVCLTLLYLEHEVLGQSVLIESDNTSGVIHKQAGMSGLQDPQ